jgi:MFS family permease
MRGRVLSLWQVAFQGTTPVGGPLVGWIIAVSDPRIGLAVGGIACLAAALGAALVLGRAVQGKRPGPPEDPAVGTR